jgi:hypothetical protein
VWLRGIDGDLIDLDGLLGVVVSRHAPPDDVNADLLAVSASAPIFTFRLGRGTLEEMQRLALRLGLVIGERGEPVLNLADLTNADDAGLLAILDQIRDEDT